MKKFKISNTEFHIYKPKQERDFKIIFKHIPFQEKVDAIRKDIEKLEHTITNIWNIKKQGTKMPLNMFYVELKPEHNNKDIYYEATHVLGYTIKFVPPHPKRKIPQCINCQRYGYTKACNREMRQVCRRSSDFQLSTQN